MNHVRRIALLALICLTLIHVPTAISALGSSSVSSAALVAHLEMRAALASLVGVSGGLRALIGTPAAFEANHAQRSLLASVPFATPGVHRLTASSMHGDSLVVVTLEPFATVQRSRVNGYRVGQWPKSTLTSGDPRYDRPAGYITVTPQNESTAVSKRFRLRDFLTHDQAAVWPKVLVLQTALLDKLELVGDQLHAEGLPNSLHIMSGFRTPQYNAQGVGDKGGRATQSRHMFGDAADVFVDADGNGRMDDLDGDGRVTIADARVLLAVAEGIERLHPELIGGLSAYPATSAHGPFVHIDTRGVRARW